MKTASAWLAGWLLAGAPLAVAADGAGATVAASIAATPGGSVRRVGQLEFSACSLGASPPTAAAWCASLRVPEDYTRPRGRSITLRIAMVPSLSAAPADDWVTYLDGGPGGAATEAWPLLQAAFTPILRRRNVLLVDQRGTGGSNALKCASIDASADEEAALAMPDLASLRAAFKRCADQLSADNDLAQYTTSNAIADLERVRVALGGPRLDLVGVSYGTRVAQQYAAHYAGATRSVILDGVVPNRLALPSEFATNLEVALKAYAALCVASSECHARYGDSYVALHRLLESLRSAPQHAQLRSVATGQPEQLRVTERKVAGVVRLYAYSPLTAAMLPAAIDAARRGDYTPLLGQSVGIAENLQSRLNQVMATSVLCAEDADLLAPDAAEAGTVLGTALVDAARAICEVWPRGARPADFHQPFASDLPVLVMSGEHDPVTPVRYGAEVAAPLPNARALIARGQGHSVLGAGCMPRLAARFIDELQPKVLDAGCLDALGDTPPVLGLNGAGP